MYSFTHRYRERFLVCVFCVSSRRSGRSLTAESQSPTAIRLGLEDHRIGTRSLDFPSRYSRRTEISTKEESKAREVNKKGVYERAFLNCQRHFWCVVHAGASGGKE